REGEAPAELSSRRKGGSVFASPPRCHPCPVLVTERPGPCHPDRAPRSCHPDGAPFAQEGSPPVVDAPGPRNSTATVRQRAAASVARPALPRNPYRPRAAAPAREGEAPAELFLP